MDKFDIIIACILIFAFVRGFTKGLIMGVASFASIFIAIYIAIHFSNFVSNYMEEVLDLKEKTRDLLSFCTTFTASLLLVVISGKLLTQIIESLNLGTLNKILGGILGFIKSGLILSVLFILFTNLNKKVNYVSKQDLKKSFLFESISKIAPIIYPSIKGDMHETKKRIQDEIENRISQ